MIRPTRNLCLAAAITAVAFPHVAHVQGFGSSVFSDGGGLLLEPVDPIVQAPGTLTAPAGGGGGGGNGITGPNGSRVDGPGGPLVTIGVATGLAYERDEGSSGSTDALLGLNAGVVSQTRNQSFRLNFGVDLDAGATETFFSDPSLDLAYTIENRDMLLGADLSWRETDVANTFLPLDFDQDDLDRLDDPGARSTHELRLRLITGRAARFGTSSSLGFRQIDFTDTVDPDLVNATRYTAETEWRFSLDRRVDLTTFASWAETSEEDAVSTTTTTLRYGAGIDVLLDQAWTGGLDIGFTGEDTETTLGSTRDEGFDITAETIRFMPNGDLRFTVVYQEQDSSALTSLGVARALELSNGAAVSGALGLVAFEGEDLYPTLSLDYSQEILRGRTLNLSLVQSAGFNDDDGAIIRTVLNAAYNHELTRNSQLGLTGTLAAVDETTTGTDTLVASVGVRYSHDLTEDWALVTQADRRVTLTDGDQTDRTDRISINLERSFSFRP